MKDFVFDPISRFLVAYQHWLYYPVMGLARVNLYIQSFLLIFSREKVHYKALELICLIGYFTWLTMLIMTLPSNERWMYLLVSHMVSGVLHVQITLSHFSMETFMGLPYTPGVEEDEWFRLQLKTTMDVECPEWMDWFHGGL